MKKLLPLIFCCIFFPSLCLADKITGNACYTYGDNESLTQAEHTAKMLAIRNAIESYMIFVESTTEVNDLQVTEDILKSISASFVRETKILKHIRSDRKICFTVQCIVEQTEIKAVIRNYLEGKKSEVRLKDNGWIRILDAYEGDDPLMKKVNAQLRTLYVTIQFLKPCTATTRYNEIVEENGERLKKGLPYNAEGQALLFLNVAAIASRDSEEEKARSIRDEYRQLCEKSGIDPYEFMSDVLTPKFRCNYRNKVFVTFYNSKGYEIDTIGQLPMAYWTDHSHTKRKIEELPGQETYVKFIIPANAKSWNAWVPK